MRVRRRNVAKKVSADRPPRIGRHCWVTVPLQAAASTLVPFAGLAWKMSRHPSVSLAMLVIGRPTSQR